MKIKIISLFALLLLVTACDAKVTPADPNPTPHDIEEGPGIISDNGNLLDGFEGFGMGGSSATNQMAVNQYLWRSALQSLSFMPLTQADSQGGVILSDWMSQENDPSKQVKVNLFILSKELRASALEVKVFNRTKNSDGTYTQQVLDTATSKALQETILSNARVLKIKANAQ